MNARPELSPITESAASTRWLAGLAGLAALNLGAGVWLSWQPSHSVDLRQIAEWSGTWIAGGNPYAAHPGVIDYPPWALVTLAPLAALPAAWQTPVWIAINLCLVFAIARALAKSTQEPAGVRAALVLLLAATAPARTLTQFSLVSDALAMAALLAPSRGAGAVLAGLALMKPQVGGVVLVWWLLSRQWARAALALLVPAALSLVFMARGGVGLTTLVEQYVFALRLVHGGAQALTGHTELRVLMPSVAGLGISLALATVLVLPALLTSRRSRRWRIDETLERLALIGTASLLSVRHLSYDFILLWPAVVAWREVPFASARRRAAPLGFWALSALLVMGVPGWIGAAVAAGAPGALLALTEVDRLMTIGLWLYLTWRIVARAPGPSGSSPRRSEVNYWNQTG